MVSWIILEHPCVITKNNIVLIIFLILLFSSVGLTYYRYFIAQNYMISAEAECDPETESCFIYECDPEWDECTGIPEWDVSYYKIVERSAQGVESCDEGEECGWIEDCLEGKSMECTVTWCDEEVDEMCAGPGLNNDEDDVKMIKE